MVLIVCSIFLGILGYFVGLILTHLELFGVLGMMVGALSPALYILEEMYKDNKKASKIDHNKMNESNL